MGLDGIILDITDNTFNIEGTQLKMVKGVYMMQESQLGDSSLTIHLHDLLR